MHRSKSFSFKSASLVLPAAILCLLALFATLPVLAQTGGEAGIQGTVTDPTGAAIPNATVTATNVATGVAISRQTSGDGLYTISPILPGTYSVHVVSSGFSDYLQNNLKADALVLTPLNVIMKVGTVGSEVTVDIAPPQLETTNATLGLTIENDTYANLPLTINGAQRDPTAFGTLAPGAQGGARLPIIGGTGNYLGQLYLDGLPAETISQQGDNRLVSQAVSVDAVDQIQVVTSTPPAEYAGAGAENFSVKSGGRQYHGQVSDFIRNTAFDVAGFTTKTSTQKNAAGVTVPLGVPIDHQNELSASGGGHIPGTSRIFFFVAYDKYHNRSVRTPASYTIATPLERTGDFTELNCPSGSTGCIGTGLTGEGANNPAFLFDPTAPTCNVGGSVCTRQPFMGMKNGVPTYNVIPSSYISPFAKAAQAFLPAPSNPNVLLNNYSSGTSGGFDNHSLDYRVDFDISPKHRISTVGAFGAVNYVNNFSSPYLPAPYVGGDLANIFPKNFDVEDAYTIKNSMVNQFKFGFTRFYQNIHNATAGVTPYEIGTLGATNLPAGQAGVEFPGISFTTNTAGLGGVANGLTTYTTNSNSTATQITTPNNFTMLDNLQYTKGAHSLTFGITVQWQEINNANPATYTGILSLGFNAADTSQFSTGGSTLTTNGNTGNSYASYLLGAVGGTPTLGLDPVAEVGGRYRPIAPYVEDTWKATHKLTVDAGLRWDYLPPYREVLDRWTFLNPTLTNAATGTPGALEFAGNYGGSGVSCGCRTPVNTYYANYGPRLGATYAFTDKTVFRVGGGRVFSQGGGVGGRAGAYQGTGQLGFNTTATGPAEVLSGSASGPSFYLNNSAAFTSLGIANTSLFGAGYVYPTAPAPGAASQILDSGNYVNPATGKYVTASSAPGYADPYFSGRAPDFGFYNAGIEQAITSTLTMAVNYVGNQSHHLYNSTAGGSNIRGYWANQLNPIYLAGLSGVTDSTGKNPILTSAATPANVAKAQAAMPGLNISNSFQAAAALNTSATIAQGLVAFPQYSSTADTWGVNTGNFSYHSLQVTFAQRQWHGLTYNVNYTWSHNIGDDGTFRSGFAIPQAALSNGTQSYHQDRIERGTTTVNTPQLIHAFGVWQMPFGKGRLGGQNYVSRTVLGGWQLSSVYTYSSGTPVAVTGSGCAGPLQGQCEPDLNPAYGHNTARINGSFGTNADGSRNSCALGLAALGTTCTSTAQRYFDINGFEAPRNNSPTGITAVNLIGNAPRTHALMLNNPGSQNIDAALRKTIKLGREGRLNLQIEGDCFNVFNHTIFSGPNASVPFTNSTTQPIGATGTGTFGQISAVSNNPRVFELAGHFNF
jgi:hypothetical protein